MKPSERIELQKKLRYSFSYDMLKLLMCRDYTTRNGIIVRQPRVGEIIDVGEEQFYKGINIWITNTTSYRVALWHNDIDWCKITDYELFFSFFKAMDPNISSLLFPNLDFSTFEQRQKVIGENEYEPLLVSFDLDMIIDNMTYLEISQYLRTMFGIFPKDEYGKGTATKEAMIFEDEEKARLSKGGFTSTLYPLISFLTNHPGFKYRIDELEDIGIFQLMDSAARIPATENTRALLVGSMSGFADTSKIPKENFNFMRELYTKDSNEDKKDKKDINGNTTTFNNVVNDMKK